MAQTVDGTSDSKAGLNFSNWEKNRGKTYVYGGIDEFTSDHTESELRREVKVGQAGGGGIQVAEQVEMQGGKGA